MRPMLSRIAASLFWIGRYLERGDGTARILDVHLQLLLEDPWIEEDPACRALLEVMGVAPPESGVVARSDVLRMLGVDRDEASSIATSLAAARENARRAREIVPTELWECVNTTAGRTPRRLSSDQAHRFFSWVHERTALAFGIVETTSSRDEGWHFFTLGRSLERADMTARLLTTRSVDANGPSWTTILRSCGAYEAFLRTYRGVPSTGNAAEFLIQNRLFPRSIIHSFSVVDECLRELAAPGAGARTTHEADARRLVGRIRSELEYRPIAEILEDLPSSMEDIQTATRVTSDAIRDEFFPDLPALTWIGDSS